jgi:hypothetical protein
MDDPEPEPGEERRPEDQPTRSRCIDCICSSFIVGAVIGVFVFAFYKMLNG